MFTPLDLERTTGRSTSVQPKYPHQRFPKRSNKYPISVTVLGGSFLFHSKYTGNSVLPSTYLLNAHNSTISMALQSTILIYHTKYTFFPVRQQQQHSECRITAHSVHSIYTWKRLQRQWAQDTRWALKTKMHATATQHHGPAPSCSRKRKLSGAGHRQD